MTHTDTIKTASNDVKISVEISYYVPRKGDTIYSGGHSEVLAEDMKPRHELTWDAVNEVYTGEAMRTKDGTNRVVFVGNGLTWREGDSFETV